LVFTVSGPKKIRWKDNQVLQKVKVCHISFAELSYPLADQEGGDKETDGEKVKADPEADVPNGLYYSFCDKG
jgi:hypothetical protein